MKNFKSFFLKKEVGYILPLLLLLGVSSLHPNAIYLLGFGAIYGIATIFIRQEDHSKRFLKKRNKTVLLTMFFVLIWYGFGYLFKKGIFIESEIVFWGIHSFLLFIISFFIISFIPNLNNKGINVWEKFPKRKFIRIVFIVLLFMTTIFFLYLNSIGVKGTLSIIIFAYIWGIIIIVV